MPSHLRYMVTVGGGCVMVGVGVWASEGSRHGEGVELGISRFESAAM